MKRIFSSLVSVMVMLTASSVLCQTASNPPPESIISAPRTATNVLGAQTLSFTNQAGTHFTIADLENQLQRLQGIVEQTLPTLMAFDTNFGSAATGSSAAETLGGVLSKVLSKNQGKNESENTSQSPSTGSKVTSNLVGVLRGILSTNNTSNSVSINPNTVAQLRALQQNLQAISSNLNNLNITAPALAGGTNSDALTPTGR
jgi:hypothetical protein